MFCPHHVIRPGAARFRRPAGMRHSSRVTSSPDAALPRTLFQERLWPGWGALLLALVAAVMVGAVPWVFDRGAGYLTGGALAVGLVAWLLASAPVVAVTEAGPLAGEPATLRAGRAQIEVEHLGEPQVLDSEQLRRAMGPQAQLSAYVCHRPWLKRGVQVAVTDRRDPTPYWLVACRRPAALAAALQQAGQAAHSEQTSWPPSS